MTTSMMFLAAVLFSLNDGAFEFSVEGETTQIDPGRSLFLDVVVRTDASAARFEMPDLRDRVRGFSLADEDAEEPVREKDGRMRHVVHWRLVPEPCARVYKIAPFVVGDKIGGPIYFEPPAKSDAAPGALEVDPKPDMPPLSWRLVRRLGLMLAALALAIWGVFAALKYLARRVKEHRMSPIERAWVELERLLKKGLPGRGRYKDFYVELTQLVRRYVQRKYDIKAPNMTTAEFLGAFTAGSPESIAALKAFLESADMVKFAGVEATPEMADGATESARSYLKDDSRKGDNNDIR